MRTRILLAGTIGLIVGVLGTLGSTVIAQQTVNAQSVMTSHGFVVQEVHVGQSCVVIVFRGGPPNDRACSGHAVQRLTIRRGGTGRRGRSSDAARGTRQKDLGGVAPYRLIPASIRR